MNANGYIILFEKQIHNLMFKHNIQFIIKIQFYILNLRLNFIWDLIFKPN